MPFGILCITRCVTSPEVTESSILSRQAKVTRSDHSSAGSSHHQHTSSETSAGVQKKERTRTSVMSLPSSNVAPPPKPSRSSEPPNRDSELRDTLAGYVPDYSLKTALRELIVLCHKPCQLEDHLNIKCRRCFILEDCQMQDHLARREQEDEVIMEAIDAAANIVFYFYFYFMCISNINGCIQPNPRYMGAQEGDPSIHLQMFSDDLRLSRAIEKARLRPIFETAADSNSHAALEEEREVLSAWNQAWVEIGNQCRAHWQRSRY
ncbi:hypothetical protein K439DRAFT_1616400 [Ramaria rubella]|nr:hypothetical protein K439DRAFT_1616400 [Ramaria rubella]